MNTRGESTMKNYQHRKHEWQLNQHLFNQQDDEGEKAPTEKPVGTRGRLQAKLAAKKSQNAHDEDVEYQSLDEREAEELEAKAEAKRIAEEQARKLAEELELEACGDAEAPKKKKSTRKKAKKKE